MDPTHFDHLVRSLFATRSRRQVLTTVLAGAGSLLGLGGALAACDPELEERCGKRCCNRLNKRCCKNKICCQDGHACSGTKDNPRCCPPDRAACAGGCCATEATCCKNKICCQPRRACTGTRKKPRCCRLDQDACDGGCCSAVESCCRGKICCLKGRCSGTPQNPRCCPDTQEPCGGSCCPPGTYCTAPGPLGSVSCCNPNTQTECGGGCCGPGNNLKCCQRPDGDFYCCAAHLSCCSTGGNTCCGQAGPAVT